MKCKECLGSGYTEYKLITTENGVKLEPLKKCESCNGKCVIEPTNEEYSRTASTEELAEFLLDVWDGIDDVINKMAEDGEISQKDAIIWWLKEKHHDI